MARETMRPWSPAYWSLVWELTRTEFKLRDQGTILGFLWTLLHPALIFVVLYSLFIKWLGHHTDSYAAYLLIGLVQWQFFEKSTTLGLTSLRRKASLIRNYDFAREIVVLAAVGSVFLSYLLEMAVMIIILVAAGLPPGASWLLLPALMAASLLFALGTSLILALGSVEFQDLERIWGILTTAGFYATPIFYPLKIVSAEHQWVMRLNPLVYLLEGVRGCILPGVAVPWLGLAVVIVLAGGATAASITLFHRGSGWISDRMASQ